MRVGDGIPRLHRALLRLHPRAFREDFGAAAAETLAARASEARLRGGTVRFWAREAGGLALSLAAEWAGGRSSRGRDRGRTRKRSGVVDAWLRELRHALRRLLRTPSFTLAAVVTLGLAIGANAAIFTVVDRVVISPLPYPESERIIDLDHGAPGLDYPRGMGITSGLYRQYAERARTVRDFAIYQSAEWTATWPEAATSIRLTRTTPAFARALRVAPLLGRWFAEDAGQPGGEVRVAVLSYGTWQQRFGGDPAVLGKVLPLFGTPYEVIGVMPRGFAFPGPDVEAWTPLPLAPADIRVGGFNFGGIGRLAEGATVEAVRAELTSLIARIPQDFPGDETAVPMIEQARVIAVPVSLKERVVGSTADTLWILLGAVGVLLLVACANVANLFLVRAESRQREVAVREALGASRRAFVGFHFAEALLLAAAGGVLGLVLAVGGVRTLVTFGPESLPRLHEVRVDVQAVAFTLFVSVLAAVALAAAPLLRRRAGTAQTLHESGRGNTAAAGRMRIRNVLMGAQVALALVLLVAAGLLAKSFQAMRAVDPGYDAADTLLVWPGILYSETYPTPDAAARFHNRVLERVRAMPGVVGAAVTTCPPLSRFCYGDPVSLPGRPWDPGDMPPIASFRRVGDDYFRTMGIRLLRGRLLDERDQQVRTHAAVIDERMAELYFPGADPIGRQILESDGTGEPYEIVGVVNHVLTWGVRAADRPPQVYFPLVSHTETVNVRQAAYVVRTEGEPLDLVPAIRAAVTELDRAVPISEVTTLDRMLADDRASTAFTMTLIGIASVVALVLGLVGIYGVTSYVVAQRTAEIGVRMALGARPGEIAGMILRQGGRVAAVGLIIGVAAALAGSRLLASLLFGVSPTDARTYAPVAVALMAVSLVACWLPARRAARLHPVAALRPD